MSARPSISPAPARWAWPATPWLWVDQFLNVRDVERLRVADASVMPDVIRANTNVTTMMIAERAAEFIREGR